MTTLTQYLTLFIMRIDTENKGKEAVTSKEQDEGKDVVPPSEVASVQMTHVQSLATDNDMPEEPPNGKP
ncbi:hypothetical protein D1007_51354 [Hordeum vulgare]|nr:hypothetical protein D1007_51354 [Hordeum vulgare]